MKNNNSNVYCLQINNIHNFQNANDPLSHKKLHEKIETFYNGQSYSDPILC